MKTNLTIPPVCPICKYYFTKSGTRFEITRDHIVPKEWYSGIVVVIENVYPTRIVCRDCNIKRAKCGHCIGAMACIEAVRTTRKSSKQRFGGWNIVFKQWNMGKVADKLRRHMITNHNV
jgi:hypothetical protein